jgi:hypothetical protein
MRIRNKMDNSTWNGELKLQRSADGHSQFVLLLHRDGGPAAKFGSMAAGIACELVDYTPEEMLALNLAGFRLAAVSPKHPRLGGITQLLRKARMKPRRRLPRKAIGRAHSGTLAHSKSSAGHTVGRTHPGYRGVHETPRSRHELPKQPRARADRVALHAVGN